MSTNISAFGLIVNLVASSTFPAGIQLTQFSDDADPFDMPSVTLADKGMGVNGDLLVWNKPAALDISVSVVPGGADDENLAILATANRTGKGLANARDVITMTAMYPDGRTTTLSEGFITGATLINAAQTAGRMKTKTYTFTFEKKTGY